MEMVAEVLSSLTHKNTVTHLRQYRISCMLKPGAFFLYMLTVFRKTYLILSLTVISKKVVGLLGAFTLHKLRADVGEGR